ncbi:lysylphosphatidylglycerol synthase transmembrane domain-containing protein [Terriglobus roseus]|uniref:Uncharacterized protein n=1 Tax=Terriglobus roseus TaxID=392734 RepID=A0A1H4S1V1_9BACT|nr:lysylphosphatidylglycerol synthase transmembrane domain-containing protein [Terriglobus roseus]SEC38017.1 hypothetical protein SAMN05443244_3317 [Terriglobus roseus]
MNKRRTIVWGVGILVLALLAWKLHTSNFEWARFWQACRSADWRMLLVAVLLIYSMNIFRAARWAIFLKPSLPAGQRVPWWSLLGSQFIGFAGLAALGRVGELIRPYLVSKRTGLSFSSQVAVVAVERVFDLGAFALIFSVNLLLSPQLATLPYHEYFHRIGYAIFGLTLFLCLFVFGVRIAGSAVARMFGGLAGRFSPTAGNAIASKILQFRGGLNTIGSAMDFLKVSLLSLAAWLIVAVDYVVIMRAFPAPVHDLTIAHSVLLMGFSVVGGVVQLPGIGGGAQVLSITALTKLFGIPGELATSAGMILWLVTTMSIIPAGVLFAQFEHVSLRGLANASDEAAEESEVPHSTLDLK